MDSTFIDQYVLIAERTELLKTTSVPEETCSRIDCPWRLSSSHKTKSEGLGWNGKMQKTFEI